MSERNGKSHLLARGPGLVFFLLVCLGAGFLGSLATRPSIEGWYRGLDKPSWNPPDWLFGPVWTALFVLMAIAAWWVVRRGDGPRRAAAMVLFTVQLVLNVTWSALFFGLRSPGLAFAEIFALWLAILATMVAFARISRPAAALLLPYLLWVSFAAVLNGTIWRLNG